MHPWSAHMVIKLETPMPCGTINADGRTRCNAPATVVLADAMGGGQWIVLPICEQHTRDLMRTYGLAEDSPNEALLDRDNNAPLPE